jgi:c-di-GMP-binding flagellar brake protein YcgR
MPEVQPSERRAHGRFVLAPMYTAVEARRASGAAILDGHAYDISEGGVRIELDETLDDGEAIDLSVRLPGEAEMITATASVVRNANRRTDLGPMQVALKFKRFASEADHRRLIEFFGHGWGVHAA